MNSFKSLFDVDMGSLSKEEWDRFVVDEMKTMVATARGEEDAPDVIFSNHAMLQIKVIGCLKEKEFDKLSDLLASKIMGRSWGPEEESALARLETKVVHSTETKREKNRTVQERAKRADNDTRKQRVRIKSTGKCGTSFGSQLSGDRTGKTGHAVILDDDNNGKILFDVDRDDMEILCNFCQTEAGPNSCSRCKAAWYCGRECQRKDWKEHKKHCQQKK